MKRKRIKDFKPCDELTAEDFDRHPVWTFDLARSEEDPGADETWVVPAAFKRAPRTTDVLFIRAELGTRDERTIPGCLLVRFENGKASIEALAILQPRYLALGLDEGTVAPWAKKDLKRVLPKAAKWFPIAYRAVLPVGTKSITISGRAR